MIRDFPYTLGADPRPRIGLIVLQADETIEDDVRLLFDPAKMRIQVSRIPSGADLTPESIRAMEHDLPRAAELFPRGAQFDAVGYACTSGASVIGPERVARLIMSSCQTREVTDPLTAAFAALRARRAKRIGIVSPYTAEIAAKMQEDFTAAGFEVAETLSFGEQTEANVALISTGSLVEAGRHLGAGHSIDALFLSCTNLRTGQAIQTLEAELGLPVLSSNHALAWHLGVLAGAAR